MDARCVPTTVRCVTVSMILGEDLNESLKAVDEINRSRSNHSSIHLPIILRDATKDPTKRKPSIYLHRARF